MILPCALQCLEEPVRLDGLLLAADGPEVLGCGAPLAARGPEHLVLVRPELPQQQGAHPGRGLHHSRGVRDIV